MSLDDDAGSYELEYDDGDGYPLDDTEDDADAALEGFEGPEGPVGSDPADVKIGSGADATGGAESSALVTVTTRELEAQLAGLLQRVKELLSCSDDEALLLLHVFSWDVRKLEERIWEDGLRERLGVSAAPDPPPLPEGCSPTDTFFDATLMEDVPFADADACACGHFFSRATWSGHLAEALANPAAALGWLCPASAEEEGCRERVRPRLFRKHLSPAQMARFHEFVLRALASKSPNMRWCPAPGCESVVFSHACIAQDVACPKGHTFCFQCRGAAHKPASCAELAKWMQKEVDESGNAKWLLAHTKPCPQCKKPIQKNEGCNHMTCSPPGGCSYQFCWICLAAWSTHASSSAYNCNKAPPLQLYDGVGADKSRQELAIYAFYSERFNNHLRGARQAEGTRPRIEKMEGSLMEACGVSAADVSFLSRALDVVVRGRNVAAWSYVHAFFVTDPAYKTLLEDSQGLMERNLEQLHSALTISSLSRVLDDPSEHWERLAKGPHGNPFLPNPFAVPAPGSATLYAASGGLAAAAAGAAAGADSGSAPAVSAPPAAAGAGSGAGSAASHLDPSVTTVRSRLSDFRMKLTHLLASTDAFVSKLLDALEVGLLDDGRAYAGAGHASVHLPPTGSRLRLRREPSGDAARRGAGAGAGERLPPGHPSLSRQGSSRSSASGATRRVPKQGRPAEGSRPSADSATSTASPAPPTAGSAAVAPAASDAPVTSRSR